MKRCYICNTEMTEKTIEINNSWGKKSRLEKSIAFVCENCEEIVFSGQEIERLQKLAKNY